MTIDLATIPAERLALLDTAVIYNGSHEGSGGPDCKHCARELLHEIVTGEHRDATPPGCTTLMAMLPQLNDGPWRNDGHRTDVMRPYLRKLLVLDPARDEERIYAVVDHVCRSILPEIGDTLGLAKEGSALRALGPIVDRRSAHAARGALSAALYARSAFDVAARTALAALTAGRTARVANTLAGALNPTAAQAALAALSAALYARSALTARAARADAWECGIRALLDRICDIGKDR